jgi:hypothetical protein
MRSRSRIPAQRSGSAPATRPAAPAPRRRRSRAVSASVPLGSLTQRQHRHSGSCRGCGSAQVTRLSLNLTDGTPVEFTSCHRCEHRTWEHGGAELPVETVLDRARRG